MRIISSISNSEPIGISGNIGGPLLQQGLQAQRERMNRPPVLLYNPQSAPCRSVLMTAAAIGVELELRLKNLKAADHLRPSFLYVNPQHTIPVLIDGPTVIVDSHLICAYLVDTYSTDDSLYPRDPVKRRKVDARLYYDCGHVFPRVRFMLEPVMYFGYDEIAEDRIKYMERCYDGLECCFDAGNGRYICCDQLTIADLCLIPSVTTAMSYAPIDEEKFPKLDYWTKNIVRLPYYNLNKEGLDSHLQLIEEQLEKNKQAKLEPEHYE